VKVIILAGGKGTRWKPVEGKGISLPVKQWPEGLEQSNTAPLGISNPRD